MIRELTGIGTSATPGKYSKITDFHRSDAIEGQRHVDDAPLGQRCTRSMTA